MLKHSNVNVYDASIKRYDFIFQNFEHIYIPFSGGKDSGLMLNLIIDYLKNHNVKSKISIYHLDYEVQYQQTTDYIFEMFEKLRRYIEVDEYYICMPFKAQCGVSMSQTYWRPWESSKEDLWIHKMPKNSINIKNHKFNFWNEDLTDYDFNIAFTKWLYKKNPTKKTAMLSGFRADECMHSCETIINDHNTYKGIQYIKNISNNLYTIYPIYDFTMQDIWIANTKLNYSYNPIYDLLFQLGVNLNTMKEASSFNNNVIVLLKYLKRVNPKMWEKTLKRIAGTNFAARYSDTQAFAFNGMQLPKDHTWNSYLNFLLSTCNNDLGNNFISKFKTMKKLGVPISSQTLCGIILQNDFNKKYKKQAVGV